jgi:hypothetical protein
MFMMKGRKRIWQVNYSLYILGSQGELGQLSFYALATLPIRSGKLGHFRVIRACTSYLAIYSLRGMLARYDFLMLYRQIYNNMYLLAASSAVTLLINVLIALIVIAVIAYIAKLVLDSIPAPPVVRTIAYLILFLVVLLVLLHYFGVFV